MVKGNNFSPSANYFSNIIFNNFAAYPGRDEWLSTPPGSPCAVERKEFCMRRPSVSGFHQYASVENRQAFPSYDATPFTSQFRRSSVSPEAASGSGIPLSTTLQSKDVVGLPKVKDEEDSSEGLQLLNDTVEEDTHPVGEKKSSGSGTYKCDKCSKAYASKYNLDAHVGSVHDNIAINCTVPSCQEIFRTKGGFHKHYNAWHKLECQECHGFFETIALLEEHAKSSHTPPDSKPAHNCVYCDDSFVTVLGIRKHMELFCPQSPLVHRKKFPHRCKKCEQTFAKREEVERHDCKRAKKKKRANSFLCRTCLVSFDSKEEATRHTSECKADEGAGDDDM